MNLFVTGADGFVGKYVLEAVRGTHTVTATTLLPGGVNPATVDHVVQLDITDAQATRAAVKAAQPDWILHLAGFSSVAESFKRPELVHQINVDGSRNLFRAARLLAKPVRILSIGSADQYGIVGSEPISEEHALKPRSPYGESKQAVEQLISDEYADLVIQTRSFPHTGPGQAQGFVVPDFAAQIAAIEQGDQEPTMKVGNLVAKRDISDVRDVVAAYLLLLEKGKLGEVYNVCSGTTTSIQSVLDQLLKLATVDIEVEQDPAKLRPVDLPVLLGDNRKLKMTTGWEPQIPLSQTLTDVLEHERKRP